MSLLPGNTHTYVLMACMSNRKTTTFLSSMFLIFSPNLTFLFSLWYMNSDWLLCISWMNSISLIVNGQHNNLRKPIQKKNIEAANADLF